MYTCRRSIMLKIRGKMYYRYRVLSPMCLGFLCKLRDLLFDISLLTLTILNLSDGTVCQSPDILVDFLHPVTHDPPSPPKKIPTKKPIKKILLMIHCVKCETINSPCLRELIAPSLQCSNFYMH